MKAEPGLGRSRPSGSLAPNPESEGDTTMERHTRQSADIPKWSALLVEAVNKPGLIMKAYSNFHSYSLGNQLLALVQCQMRWLQPAPIDTFPNGKSLADT